MTTTAKAREQDRSKSVFGRKVAVIGAGVVGVCSALELQRRGAQVVLIDRQEPGRETSYGNAGVISRSSLIPLNNPQLFADLPGLIGNNQASLRYDMGYLLRNAGWVTRFLNNARSKPHSETVTALDALIRLSIPEHLRLIADAGLSELLSDQGWICLYRSEVGFDRTASSRDIMADHDIDTAILSSDELQELEPGLNGIFPRALWVRDCHSISNPGALVQGYAAQFFANGGTFQKAEVQALEESQAGVRIVLSDGRDLEVEEAAICLGPWGRPFLERLGYNVRLVYERGYHRHFTGSDRAGGNRGLTRPIYDTAGGYVLAPMQQGLRLTTGVELADRSAQPNYRQIELAERSAREAIDLGDAVEETPWLGSRPTFPDSRPAIGRLPDARRVSVAFGHQHIGVLTAPGSARLLADLMEEQTPPIDAEPFVPSRQIWRS